MTIEKPAKTYSQIPWRRQLRLIGLFVFGLLLVAMVASLYLYISARIAETGAAVRVGRRELEDLDRQIAHLESRLAILLSAGEMEKRAREMGFQRLQPEQVIYLVVPGYPGRPTAILAGNRPSQRASTETMPREYTESIFEWLGRQWSYLIWLDSSRQ